MVSQSQVEVCKNDGHGGQSSNGIKFEKPVAPLGFWYGHKTPLLF